jgi:multidrug efflux pump subunit AcrA (membrane-fusion protein)
VVRLEAPEEGVVEEVLRRESDAVEAGQPVLRISSPDRTASEARYASQSLRYGSAARAARHEANSREMLEAAAREASASSGLAGERARVERLTVSSPIGGRLLTHRLQDLQGSAVTEGELLAEVGDVSRLRADLPVTERLVGDIAVGSPVRASIPQEPLRIFTGRIVQISAASMDRPGTATSADPAAPPERPDRFTAVAEFENGAGLLRPGSVVRAKIYGKRASYAERSVRMLWRWLQRMIW